MGVDAFLLLQNASWGIIGSGISLSLPHFPPTNSILKLLKLCSLRQVRPVTKAVILLVGLAACATYSSIKQREDHWSGILMESLEYNMYLVIRNFMCGRWEFDERLLAV